MHGKWPIHNYFKYVILIQWNFFTRKVNPNINHLQTFPAMRYIDFIK